MEVAVFSTRSYDRSALEAAAAGTAFRLRFLEARLGPDTAGLAEGSDAVCLFVNDQANAAALAKLAEVGVWGVTTRSAGFNHVDLDAARAHGLPVLCVPGYGPHGVAEHALALLFTLNRHTHRAAERVRSGNFALDGMMGFELRGKTVGVVGTGTIGATAARKFLCLGCRVLAMDRKEDPGLIEEGAEYVHDAAEFWPRLDALSLHCPHTPETHHLVDAAALDAMPDHAVVINTSRGGLLDTEAALAALKEGRIGGLGIDVYEHESGLFFEDHSDEGIRDPLLAQLVALPNALVTGHQAFFTREAVQRIAETTVQNLRDLDAGTADRSDNLVT